MNLPKNIHNYRQKKNIGFKKITALTLALLILTSNSFAYGLNEPNSKPRSALNKALPAIPAGIGGIIFAGETIASCILLKRGKFINKSKTSLKNENTIIENMPADKIKANLKSQIRKFENIGQGYFKVDKTFLKNFKNAYCLHALLSLNDALGKYPVFTKKLIEIKYRFLFYQ